MIYILRNISIRLWISVLISMPSTFIIFPTVQTLIPDIRPYFLCVTLTFIMFIIIGYIMNISGERLIYRYINEAKNWEREGFFHKSESCYLKAIEIFDSYLLTFITSGKISLSLTGAIARFSLTAGLNNSSFDRATTFFLLKNPHETEVAYLWLKQMVTRINSTVSSINIHNGFNAVLYENHSFSYNEEKLLALLAEMEPLSFQLVPLLAEIFTATQRADFAAKRVFSIIDKENIDKKNIYKENKNTGNKVECIESLENLEIPKSYTTKSNKVDEKKEDVQKSEIVKKSETVEESDRALHVEQAAIVDEPHYQSIMPIMQQYQIDSPFSYKKPVSRNIKRRKKSSSYFIPSFVQFTILPSIKSVFSWLLALIIKGFIILSSLPMNTISIFINFMRYILGIVLRLFNKISNAIAIHPDFTRNVKRLVLFSMVIGIITLFINTITYLFRTPSQPPPPSISKTVNEDVEVQVVPQKKFTIQVAAYLVKSHAEKYLSKLQNRGVPEGTITEIKGGGKIWYLIRVGSYETKESATEYGNKLKSQGIVDDFFVDNSGG